MPKLATLLSKYEVDEDEVLDIMDHIHKAGSSKAGIEAWVKSIESNMEDLRFQLKTKGHNVDIVTAAAEQQDV